MPRQKRKHPRSATDPQPPQLKRRRLVDDLERAPEEVIATRVDRYNRHHVFSRGFKLKDEFLTDPKTLSDIIAVGKRMEIEVGSRNTFASDAIFSRAKFNVSKEIQLGQ